MDLCQTPLVWKPKGRMAFGRMDFTMTALGGYLQAVGGRYGSDHYQNVERYDPKLNTWSAVANFPTYVIWRHCAVANEEENRLYVIGGDYADAIEDVYLGIRPEIWYYQVRLSQTFLWWKEEAGSWRYFSKNKVFHIVH